MGTQTQLFNNIKPSGSRAVKSREDFDGDKVAWRKLQQRRYRLHKQLRGIFPIDGTKCEIYAFHYKCFEDIPRGPRYDVGQLIKMGYTVIYGLL